MIKFMKENKMLSGAIIALILLYLVSVERGNVAALSAIDNLKSVGMVLPPIFVLIGLLDVWVPKEVMVKWMGNSSGVVGASIAIFLGAVGAGPLVVAFPIAALLIKKGARLAYVFLFLGAWTSVKLPIFMFELSSFGPQFTFIHVGSALFVYVIGSFIMEKTLSSENKKDVLKRAEEFA